MKLRKKVLLTTLSLSLAIGTASVLPALPGGAYGVAQGAAATATTYDSQFKAFFDQLGTDDAAVNNVRSAFSGIDPLGSTDLIDVFWSRTTLNTVITESDLLALIRDLGSAASAEDLQDAIDNNRTTLQKLAIGAGISGNITLDDFASFKGLLKDDLKTRSATIIPNLIASSDGMSYIMNEVIASLGNVVKPSSTNKIAKVLNKYGITGTKLQDLNTTFKADPAFSSLGDAEAAAVAAFMRSELVSYKPTYIENNGKKLTPELSVWGIAIPNEMLDWTVTTPGSKISYNIGSRSFVLDTSTTGTYTAAVEARDILKHQLIYKGNVSMTYSTSSGGNPSGGNPDGNTESGETTNPTGTNPDTGTVKGPDTADAEKKLNETLDQVKNVLAASGDPEQAAKQAQKAVAEAIREAATIDLSSTVKQNGDTSTVTVDVAQVKDLIKSAKEIADSYNAALAEAAPGSSPAPFVLTLNLGNVNTASTDIELPKDLLAEAAANGVTSIALQVNGVTLTLNLSEFKQDTKVKITKKDNSEASQATSLKQVSEVFDFEFTSNGQPANNFDEGIEVRLPVKGTDGVDTELLVFAKIENGKLVYKGGSYDPDSHLFIVNNKSFSTYVIVENKVVFTDTDNVKSWAGRQIDVVAAKGILEGRGNQVFDPNAKVTRAEFAKLIVKTFGLEDSKATESFDDVNDTDWFKPYVAAAVKAGIIQGRSSSKFDPNANITRAEMATIAARALVHAGYKNVANPEEALAVFKDAANISESLKTGVALATKQGIIIGTGDNQFDPNGDSTRAQAAVIIYRLLNK